ncbi:uridine kinase [Xylona heveae TC161]|uniref:Uridine kinase n=1 Tax=Xylona heveae (strain CBS 132557 / TC161) TaxID=1328760 RepID=A0A165HC70_XYLHT|nr:uridine kinase [Xylona heveae TC161]KZF23284.1 uridine kinase [Xylona heveae TC161]
MASDRMGSIGGPQRAHYSPPWANTSIIGVAGSSGSGKTSLAMAIVSSLNLPWVVVLSMDSYYRPLTPEQSEKAYRNEYDFDSPEAIDFDALLQTLRDLKQGKKADIPVYSFEKHQRETKTIPIYSPHVLVVEGIFALYDPRVVELMDMRIYAEADLDVCLARRITRDVRDRGRDIEGCIKQWFSFVKPNYNRFVEPQRVNADIIVPRSIENRVAIDMVVQHIQRILTQKSQKHQDDLHKLGIAVKDEPLSPNVLLLKQTPQIVAMSTILQNPSTHQVDFVFYFDRLTTLLITRAMENMRYREATVTTPHGNTYHGLLPAGEVRSDVPESTGLAYAPQVSAVVILRAGSSMETGLKRVIPDCRTGRLLIQTNYRTGEPELHYQKLPEKIDQDEGVLLLDPQMSSGGAALMAVKVLVDHGIPEEKITFVTYFGGRLGINRLLTVFPDIKVVVSQVVEDVEERWIADRYFGC